MISVIVPIYNASLYLRKCIDSILSQSFNDFELILINDGSTDNSLAICKEYEKSDKRIIVISETNGGVSRARNKGLQVAKGHWITFVDADDYLMENALQILYNRVMQTGTDLVLANSQKLKNGEFRTLLTLSNEVLPNVIFSIKHFALWGYLFNGDIIRQNNLKFIDGLAYSEDRIFIYQMAQYCRTIAFCDRPIYVYRINEGSVCASPNGIRKACQHIEAAYYLNKLARKYENKNKQICSYLRSKSKHVVHLGISLFVETNASIKDMSVIVYKYKEHFKCNNLKARTICYTVYFYSLITYYRRKIFRFKK